MNHLHTQIEKEVKRGFIFRKRFLVDVCKLVYVSSISKVRISDSEKQFLVDVCKLVYVSSLSKVRISDSEKQFLVDVCKLVYVSSISKVRISDSEKQFLVDVCKLVYVSSLSKVRISDSEKQFLVAGFHTEGGDGGGFIPLMILARGDMPPIKLQNSVFFNGHFSEVLQESVQKTNPLFLANLCFLIVPPP